MKNALCGISAGLMAVMALAAEPVDAQMRFGVRGGVNFATVTGDFADGQGPDSDGEGTRTGFLVGGFMEMPLAQIVGLHVGANYSQRGAEAEGIDAPGGDVVTKLDYLEVPVLLRVGIPMGGAGINLYAGPSIAYLIKCEGAPSWDISKDCEDRASREEVKNFDLAGQVGAGLGFGPLRVDGFLTMGLQSFLDAGADLDLKHEVWSVSAAFVFPIGD